MKSGYKWIGTGLAFAVLWASASTATKIGLQAAQPLVIAQVRFAVAGIVMLFFAHLVFKYKLPKGKEWKQIIIYGLLNITIYLGCYVIAMQEVTAGIGSLSIATNPVFISFFAVVFLRQKLKANVLIALILGTAGVFIVAWPLMEDATVTTPGLFLLLFGMMSYSVGAIYFSSKNWGGLKLLTINGWQTLLGGLLLLPMTALTYDSSKNHFNATYWSATLWLALPVSIVAVQLWLWLLKTNTIKAGLWLFLCPVFGFAIAVPMLGDPISIYTIIGVFFVLVGLFLAQRKIKNANS
ncbi:MAG: DMT family transporter [Ginsengibacter sp.]